MAGLRAICFPSTDRVFARVVHRALASEKVHSTADLEAMLRPEYPDVRVRQREPAGEPGLTWYVYRDRHFPRVPRPG